MTTNTVPEPLPQLPFKLADLKEHVTIDLDSEDKRLAKLAWAAVEYVEKETNRSLAVRTYQKILHCFPSIIILDKPPTITVESISYFDEDNVQKTITSPNYYLMKSTERKSTIHPVDTWPTTYDRPDAVTITYTAGYQVFPFDLEAAIAAIVGTMNENRETVVTGTIVAVIPTWDNIINKYRVRGYA